MSATGGYPIDFSNMDENYFTDLMQAQLIKVAESDPKLLQDWINQGSSNWFPGLEQYGITPPSTGNVFDTPAPSAGGEPVQGGSANPARPSPTADALGGYIAPTQTYSGHTGTSSDIGGPYAKHKKGTGGGTKLTRPPVTREEMILARPDLQSSRSRVGKTDFKVGDNYKTKVPKQKSILGDILREGGA